MVRKFPVLLAMKSLVVEASIENLNGVIDFINSELERHNCPPNIQSDINLAAEEIFTNIANYAYQPASGSAAISIAVGKEEAVVRFEDTGKIYNPLEHPKPAMEKPLMERDVGGLGVFLVKKIMDKVDYERIENRNVLVLTKRFGKINASALLGEERKMC